MRTAVICSGREHHREIIKSALAHHLNLITVECHDQLMEALSQKAAVHTVFIDVADEEGTIDLGIFKAVSDLKPKLRIIAIGEHATEQAAVEAVRHGASGYMVLPVKAEELLTAAR